MADDREWNRRRRLSAWWLLGFLALTAVLTSPSASAEKRKTGSTSAPSRKADDIWFGSRDLRAGVWAVWSWKAGRTSGAVRRVWGLMNRQGRIVLEPKYHSLGGIRDGMIAFPSQRDPKKFGYMNYAGKVVIEPRFERANRFGEGLATVRIAGRWYVIDNKGKRLPGHGTGYRWLTHFQEGRCLAVGTKGFGFVDRDGLWRVRPSFASALPFFSDGLAGVMTRAKIGKPATCGYVDKTGRMVIPAWFSGAWFFSEGLAPVNVGGRAASPLFARGGRWGFIDKKGRFRIKPTYTTAFPHYTGLAAVCVGGDNRRGFSRGGKWGYIDKAGQWVIPAEYDSVFSFEGGDLAAVAKSETPGGPAARGGRLRWGYIDRRGRVRIALVYDETDNSLGDLALVRKGKQWRYIDKEGKAVWIEPNSARSGEKPTGSLDR